MRRVMSIVLVLCCWKQSLVEIPSTMVVPLKRFVYIYIKNKKIAP